MGIKFKSLGVILSILTVLLPSLVLAEQPPRMLITEVKTGGIVAGTPTEFVEIYNDSDQVVGLDNWTVEYAKPAAKITECTAEKWKLQDISGTIKEYSLSGTIQPRQHLIIEIAMNDNVGGSIRLSNAGVIWDLVGWGNALSQGVCKETDLAPLPVNAKSIRRLVAAGGVVIDTNNNEVDFTDGEPTVVDEVAPGAELPDVCSNIVGRQTSVPLGYAVSDGACNAAPIDTAEICKGVTLSEIVPNPAGPDIGSEYVELHNATSEPVSLDGCVIKVGNVTKQLTGTIAPGLQVYYGLVLPNTDGGTVEFVTNTTEEIVTYPANLKDDQAWALIGGRWQLTEQSTPGTANVLIVTVEEVSVATSAVIEPCSEGKYRNPETNRCKTIEAEENLKPCEPGQVRNPETNRCKKMSEVIANLKPCEAGQERNPETNRCRKISSVALLSACKEGQERNTETNRCRKVAAATTSTPSSELEKEVKSKQNVSYGIFGAMAVLVLGYGAYEYRTNIANFFTRSKK